MQLGKAKVPCDVKEEMKFVLTQAKKNVEAWKSHIIRSVNQDAARLDILNALYDTSVLAVHDWAVKFIPRKYRESQADWLCKRGIYYLLRELFNFHFLTRQAMSPSLISPFRV